MKIQLNQALYEGVDSLDSLKEKVIDNYTVSLLTHDWNLSGVVTSRAKVRPGASDINEIYHKAASKTKGILAGKFILARGELYATSECFSCNEYVPDEPVSFPLTWEHFSAGVSASFDPPEGFKDDDDDYFPIRIKTLTGKQMEQYVSPSDSVEALKMIIREKAIPGPLDQLRLIHEGRQMEEGCLLSDYGIEKFSVVRVVLKLRGGMFHRAASRSDYNLLVDSPLSVNIKYGPNSSDELELELHEGKFALRYSYTKSINPNQLEHSI